MLQYAFMIAVEAFVAAALIREASFEYPGEGMRAVVSRLPGLASSIVAVPVLFVGLWIWLRTGKTTIGETVRGIFVRYVATSPTVLALGALAFSCAAAHAIHATVVSEPIRLSVVDVTNGHWRVFLDCANVAAPLQSCQPPRELGDKNSAVLRVLKAGAPIVLESTASDHEPRRLSAQVRGDTTIVVQPPFGDPPAFDPNRVVVAIYDFRPRAQSWSPTLISKNIEDALALDDTPDVQVIRMDRVRDSAAADDWATRGFMPAVQVSGEFDSIQVRASVATHQQNFSVSLRDPTTGADEDFTFALPFIKLDLSTLRDEAIAVNPTSNAILDLVADYPKRIAETIRTLLALHFLDHHAPAVALALLARNERSSSTLHAGDNALRAILRTSARIMGTGEPIDPADVADAATLAEQFDPDAKGDVIVTGPLRKSLPKLAYDTFLAAVAARAHRQDPRARNDFDTRLEHATSAHRAPEFIELMEWTYGQNWRRSIEYAYKHGAFLMEAMSKAIQSSEPKKRVMVLRLLSDVRETLHRDRAESHSLLCDPIRTRGGPPFALGPLLRDAYASSAQCRDCDVLQEVRAFFEEAAQICGA